MIDRRTESFKTDLTPWVVGPYHGALSAPLQLNLHIDGEVVANCRIESGFLHRGLEKAFELHSWRASVAYADHLDPEVAAFGELALCLAVEELAGLETPERAKLIRIILSELSRISGHLAYIARSARAVGSETIVHYVLRDRERVLDLFELLTGSRFSLNFMRFGGVKADVTEGFIERVLEVCDLIRVRLKEYNDLFSFNHAFLKRTTNLAPISLSIAKRHGLTGPNARASGLALDVRKSHPYSGYDKLEFEVPLGKGERGTLGDAHDRFVVRLREISQSIEILKHAADSMPIGSYLAAQAQNGDMKIPAGEAYSRIESSRGLLGCHVVSDGGPKPARVQFRPASMSHLTLLSELMVGARVDDLPVIFTSLDIGIAEVDR